MVAGCQKNESCSNVLNFLEKLDDKIRCTHTSASHINIQVTHHINMSASHINICPTQQHISNTGMSSSFLKIRSRKTVYHHTGSLCPQHLSHTSTLRNANITVPTAPVTDINFMKSKDLTGWHGQQYTTFAREREIEHDLTCVTLARVMPSMPPARLSSILGRLASDASPAPLHRTLKTETVLSGAAHS